MKIYNFCLIILSIVFLTSCEKDTEGISRSTHYVSFHIKGENPLLVPVGSNFSDPGAVATENGVDVTSKITTTSDVNASVMGKYTIVYSGTNKDGLKSKAIREVYVCDPTVTTDISGEYAVASGTHRISLSSGAKVEYSGYAVTITRVAPGFFAVSDFFGGYYDKRANYGPNYAMTGYVALANDNSISLVSSSIKGWGDGLGALKAGTYTPSTGVIVWKAEYAGLYSFNLTLNKK